MDLEKVEHVVFPKLVVLCSAAVLARVRRGAPIAVRPLDIHRSRKKSHWRLSPMQPP
jgi:hypothetical protein